MNPSILYPIGGGLAGYLAGKGSPWAILAGLLAGAAINANLRTQQANEAISAIGGNLGGGAFKLPTYGKQVMDSLTGKPLTVTWSNSLQAASAIDRNIAGLPKLAK